ncbi:anion permease [Halopseudomonas laoshanensis]|uniref:Phosphate transporter n=1 Tax=Halopseudomonas laoshanensis TaxID=2268758 RepID=A0A7V7GUE2_9GAMM|nr:inorganic phosphate transporter [Halopseudomonas laoshanensis]KAA0695123.1 anion permease [Halopseudomonas laoshanensis]MBQ0743801.1 inorganic phosphate transporter [Pseudomonas sp.]MBQ0778565.1 inorganic phosphate transporter [Pseudomonas sp.]WOD11955.1 anion permease [Pseudomonas sp. NyZ704]
MTLIAEYGTILLVLACAFGFFMAWGVGANDVANAMGTSVGSKALTIKQAILIAMVFEFLGAYLAGGSVTQTIRSGILESEMISPEQMIFGMLASLLAAGTWLFIASMKGWPVSTTHSIIGAVIGFGAVGVSMDAVNWGGVAPIVASWVISPTLSGFVAFLVFMSVHKLILDTEKPFENAKKYVPFYMFAVGFFVALMTVTKGLKHVGLDLSPLQSFGLAVGTGLAVTALGVVLLTRVKADPEADKDFHFASVEKVFAILMIFTACAMAFAHGSNDVANAVGPLAAIVGVLQTGTISDQSLVPGWVLLLGGIGIVIGLATYGYRVIATIGKHITELTPSRGFAAELATAITVVGASGAGLPVSTTHTLVGAVLGVGIARGIGALNLRVIGTIFSSWLITLPAGAGLSIVFFFILSGIFG